MAQIPDTIAYRHRHLLGIEGLYPPDIIAVLDRAEAILGSDGGGDAGDDGATLPETRIALLGLPATSSFLPAAHRLSATPLLVEKGGHSWLEGDLARTAAAMTALAPDLLVARHRRAGAVAQLAGLVSCPVINAGDGPHEEPVRALRDAWQVRRRFGHLDNLTVAVVGDIAHTPAVRSALHLWNIMGARPRLIALSPLLPAGIDIFGAEIIDDPGSGLADCDVVLDLAQTPHGSGAEDGGRAPWIGSAPGSALILGAQAIQDMEVALRTALIDLLAEGPRG